MSKMKGSLLQGRVDYAEQLNMPDRYAAFVAKLDPRFQNALKSNQVISAGWYPAEWINSYFDALTSVYGDIIPNVVFESGRFVAKKAFAGFYSIFVKLTSPRVLIDKVPIVWKLSYDTGEAATRIVTENEATIEVRNFPEATPLFAVSLSGWCFGGLELYKLKNLQYHVKKSPTPADLGIVIEYQWG